MSTHHERTTWWRRFWRRGAMEAALEKELRFHLDEHARDLVAQGVAPAEAQRQARLALGGPEQVKEACRDARGTRWLEDLLQDLRYAARTLRQMPGFTTVALFVLALGIGATTVMFTVINAVLLRPLAFPDSGHLFAIRGSVESSRQLWAFSHPDFADVARESRSLELAAWIFGGGTISQPGEPEFLGGRRISAQLFSVLGIPVARGRAFRAEEDRPGAAPVAIISRRLSQRRFGGDEAAIGRSLVFDGRPYTVVGVAPEGFQLEGDADIFTPIGQDTEPRMSNRQARFVRVVGRLRSGVTRAEAQTELSLIARRLATKYPASNAGLDMRPRPLQQEVVGDVGGTLWLLFGAVGLVVLIACVNIASLLLARSVSREREFAMRTALGAGRGRLIRQCLTESALLGLTGGVLGVLVAAFGVRQFVVFWPGGLPREEEIHVDWRVWLFALAVSLASGVLFGLAPALRVRVKSVEQALRAGSRTIAGRSKHLHGAFVISEIALAGVLLVSAGMLGRTLLTLSSLDPGVDVRSVFAARVALSPGALESPDQIRAGWQDVLDRARRVPGVESVAVGDIIPMRAGENTLPYSTTGAPLAPNEAPFALASAVTPEFLNVMGIPLRRGRFIDDHDRDGSEPVIVIDEVLAQHAFGAEDPVGKRLWIPAMGGPIRIIGVAGHVRHWGLAADDRARVRDQIYYPFAQVPGPLLRFFSSIMSIAVRTKVAPLTVVEPLRQELRGAGGDQALYQIQTLEALVNASLARQRFLAFLFGAFACVALLLACVGLYGVLAYLTSQRTPELGVRMALGATSRDVVRLVLQQSVGLIVVGVAAGAGAAWAASRLLSRVVEGMRAADPATFALMSIVLVAAALLASALPARRAGRVDALQALRQD